METIIPAEISEGEKQIVLLTHDESCFKAHDGKQRVWMKGEKNALYPKHSGRSIMVSQFLCQCHGAMEVMLTEEILQNFPALSENPGESIETLKVIKPGKMPMVIG